MVNDEWLKLMRSTVSGNLVFAIYPQLLSIAQIVNSLKPALTWATRSRKYILDAGKTDLFCSQSYFAATCGGVTLDVLRKYVEQQGTGLSSPP